MVLTLEDKREISKEIIKKMLNQIKSMEFEKLNCQDSIVFHRSWYDENLKVKVIEVKQ